MNRMHWRVSSKTLGVAVVLFAACMLAGCPVGDRVIIDFDGAPHSGPPGTSVTFVGTAEAVDPYVLAEKFRGEDPGASMLYVRGWAWDFGDGARGAGRTATHVYNTAGVFDITLSVTVSENPPGAKADETVVIELKKPAFITITDPNQPPVADAGVDQQVGFNTEVQLDGSGSEDPDGDPLAFAWVLLTVPEASRLSTENINGANSANPTVTPDVAGAYVFELTVDDGSLSDSDTVTVEMLPNGIPMADAGNDQNVSPGTVVTLDGRNSSDPNGDPLTFAWLLVNVPVGSTAVLDDPAASQPAFTADLPGVYTVELVVSDPWNDSAPDTVVVTATNGIPVAKAGPDHRVVLGAAVTLDGRGSFDPDGDPLTFAWQLVGFPAGSTAALDNPASAQPTFTADLPGLYTARLVVSDPWDSSAPDTVVVSTLNTVPTADAGPDQTRLVGQTATLDGSGSSDADGDPLTFSWSFVSRPALSSSELSDAASVSPRFTIDAPGDYVIQLVVNDGDADSEPDTVVVSTDNSPPVADAGPDQTRLVTETATLDGSGSSDVDGDPLTFSWSFVSIPGGSAAALNGADTVSPRFTIDVPGDYVVQLVVNDDTVDSEPDTVVVSTDNSPPVADAGADQTRLVTETATLDGSGSSDVDGDPLTFAWSFVSKPEGNSGDKSAAVLDDPTSVTPSFVVDLPGNYVLQLVVNDGTVDSEADTVVVSTDNSPPVADAGPDQTRLVTETATLDGSGSSDVDGDPLTYSWSFVSRPEGDEGGKSTATLDDPTTVNPSFVVDLPGNYVLQLVVNDGTVDSEPDTVVVSTENSPPVADAGADQTRLVTETATLDGSGSSDVDGDPLAYAWRFVSMPAGSAAALTDVTAVRPSFVVDLPGNYVLQLVVNDGTVDSEADTVVVSTENSPPVADAGPDQTRRVTETATLDGRGSSDVDGDPLTYSWRFVSRPGGGEGGESTATLDDPTAVNPSFVVDLPGEYILQLVVNDGTVDSAPDTVVVSTVNSPPVADAGPDQTRRVTETATLDGRGSSDVDGDPLTFSWRFVSKPGDEGGAKSNAVLDDPTAVSPSFVVDLPGEYILQLVVNDGTVDSAPDTVVVSTVNSPPVADAGPDQTRLVTQRVTLDGSGSSDVDGDPLTYSWSFLPVPRGADGTTTSTAALDDPAAVGPSFVIDLPGQYVLQLIVNDGTVDSAPDTVVITTENSPPVADAGPDQTRLVTETVTLNGSRSSDVDGDPLTYAWSFVSKPSGGDTKSAAVLDDPTAVSPTFVIDLPGTYILQLVVNDGTVDSAPDTVVITTENSPPVADAGPDQTRLVTETVTLNGSGSSDVDGDPLTYAWSFVSKPSGGATKSAAVLDDPTAVSPTFVIDLPGVYVLQLVVNDGTVDSAPDTVVITTENSPPVADAGPDQTHFVTDMVTLNGGGSHDVDGDPLTYAWSFLSVPGVSPDQSTATLSNPASPTPTFVIDLPGTYVVQLIVNDGTVDSAPDTVVITTENSPPVADAGPDQSGRVFDTITLDGSGSSDVDGDSLIFAWSVVSSPDGVADPSALLNDATAVQPFFTIEAGGTYIFQLVVNDGTVDSVPDTVVVTTENTPPVADAGADQTGRVFDTITLDGTASFDVDNDPLTYSWSFLSKPEQGGPAKSTAQLVGADTATPSFIIDVAGTYVLQLIVNDGTADSAPDTVQVTTENTPPVADAGPDREVPITDDVMLDGTGSFDVDNDPLTYRWSVLSVPLGGDQQEKAGPFDFILDDVTSPTPSFFPEAPGDYVFQLIVNDGTVDSLPDGVVITAVNQPPTITLIGDGALTLECGTPYQEAGAVVSDPESGDISHRLNISGTVDAGTPGEYTLTYTASDIFGAEADPVTRTVTVEDTTTPDIELEPFDGPPLHIECGSNTPIPGASATDTCDTQTPIPVDRDTGGLDLFAPGTYTVTYSATDGAGNTGTVELTVIVEDTTPPVLEILGADPLTVECGDPYVDPGAVATDTCEGDLNNVTIDDSQVDTTVPGTYAVGFSVSDGAGNTATGSRTVVVEDTTPPGITFIGPSVQTVECGTSYEELGAVAEDNCDPDPFLEINVIDENTSVTGSFLVVYTATDAAGNTASRTRTVIVEDTIPPEITQVDPGPLHLNCGGYLLIPGATAIDQCDGETVVQIDVSGVNMQTRGEYQVIYRSTDNAGNTGESIRTVFIEGICPLENGTVCPDGGLPRGALVYQAGFEVDLDGFILDNTAGSGNGLWHRSAACYGPNAIDGTPTMLYFGQDDTCDYDTGQATGGLATSPTISLPGGAGTATLVFNYFLITEGASGSTTDYAAVLVFESGSGFETLADNSDGAGVVKAVIFQLCDDAPIPDGGQAKILPPGSVVNWYTAVIDISRFRGSDINVQFLFDSGDQNINFLPGFAVDNVTVYASPEPTP